MSELDLVAFGLLASRVTVGRPAPWCDYEYVVWVVGVGWAMRIHA